MEAEYVTARLAAIKSRLVSPQELMKVLEVGDLKPALELIESSVYAREMEEIIRRGGLRPTPALMERVINEGLARLKRRFAELVIDMDSTVGRALVMRWELEELKSAIRYLMRDGFSQDRRFSFTPMVVEPKNIPAWGGYKTATELITLMKKAGHPLAPGLDAALFAKNPLDAELGLERYFFTKYLRSLSYLPWQIGEYYRDQLDMANVNNAMLARVASVGPMELREFYIDGGGLIRREDFETLAFGQGDTPHKVIKERLGAKPRRGSENSATLFYMELRRAFYVKYRRHSLKEPVGPWGLIFFMEELSANASNLHLALSFGLSHTPMGDAAEHFIRAWQ
ncbi:MAG: V-type ATPase subunit [Nitrospinae bacterium]|nr:V-type ATPase subunit [Nitrospinota bacterium]